MAGFRPIISVVLMVSLPMILGGCPLAIVGGLGAAGGAGYAANDERGVHGSTDDFAIKSNIQKAWAQANPLLETLNINVYEGRVLLTGAAPTPESKAQAAEIAGRVPGVRAVYDEIEMTTPETAWADAQDSWINSRLRTELAFNRDIRSVNYTIETVNGSVYLIGSARSRPAGLSVEAAAALLACRDGPRHRKPRASRRGCYARCSWHCRARPASAPNRSDRPIR